jgi:ATP-dependent DNA helicase RecG
MRGENRKIKNVALFMFSPHPEKFFPGARIDINVYSQDKETLTHRDSYKGPVWLALHNALEYIHQMHILKFIHKPKDDAHSVVTYNWPFVAVEEALTNAVRHRDYSLNKPINVNIYHDRIEIVNYGDKGNNSRLGKFMSALKLTRENGSGLRYIIEAMERNGSPKPWLDYNEAIPNYKVVLQKREEINI